MVTPGQALAVICILIGSLVLIPTPHAPLDSTDNPNGHRSGLAVLTDCLTGRQYLMAYKGGLTPRIGKDGQQMIEICKK